MHSLAFFSDIFKGTITLGTAIVGFLVLGFGGFYATKNKALDSSREQAEHWREDYMAERVAREDAEARYLKQRELKHEALAENAALKMATDLTSVMKAIAQMNSQMQVAEKRMVARFEAFSKVQNAQTQALEAIAARMNGTE